MKSSKGPVVYRNCNDCKVKMIYVPRRPKCMDCYKKALKQPEPNAIDLFIPDSDEETNTSTNEKLKYQCLPRPNCGFMHNFD
jgi:hypothetical protein